MRYVDEVFGGDGERGTGVDEHERPWVRHCAAANRADHSCEVRDLDAILGPAHRPVDNPPDHDAKAQRSNLFHGQVHLPADSEGATLASAIDRILASAAPCQTGRSEHRNAPDLPQELRVDDRVPEGRDRGQVSGAECAIVLTSTAS